MNTNQLYKEYARVIEMCEGTELEDMPWVCVKGRCKSIFLNHPHFDRDPSEYEFAVAVLEGRPVFVGDSIYLRIGNNTKSIISSCQDMSAVIDGAYFPLRELEKYFTWTPPAPKRTFTLNGVELPCPVDQIPFDDMNNPLQIGHCAFQFENEEDRKKVANMFINLLREARDK